MIFTIRAVVRLRPCRPKSRSHHPSRPQNTAMRSCAAITQTIAQKPQKRSDRSCMINLAAHELWAQDCDSFPGWGLVTFLTFVICAGWVGGWGHRVRVPDE